MINIDHSPHIVNLLHQLVVQLIVLHVLGLELIGGCGFVHAELAGAAGVGVGVSQLQV